MHLIYSQSYNIFANPFPCISSPLPSLPQLLRPLLPRAPRNLPPYPRDRAQLSIPKLHAPELDHTRVQAERLSHLVLHGAVGVVAHDEVVALVVDGLMLGGALWERGDAPVGDAADGAAVLNDEGAGCADDAVGESVSGRSWVRRGCLGGLGDGRTL